MAIKGEQLIAAAQKAAKWIVSRQTERGNYIGNEEPDSNGFYPDTHDVGCYYKSIFFLQSAGETLAAARAINYVVESFMSPKGDFFNKPDNRTSGSYTPTYCQLYPNMWLMRAAASMEWTGLTEKIFQFILKHRDPETGGIYSSINPKTDIIDSNSTGYGILMCLLAGRLDLAIQSAELILRLIREQPEPTERFYLRWTRNNGFQTDLVNIPEKHRVYAVLDAKKPKQAYWCWGWPMNGLIKLYLKTQEERFLKAAIDIYDFLASCHEHAFHFVTAGKDGWGSSMLYRITGDKRYLKTSLSQMDFILSCQQKDGWMLGPASTSFEDQPLRTTYDFTADFGSWLIGTSMELAGRE